MSTKFITIRGVEKEAVLLKPNTSFDISFMPENGNIHLSSSFHTYNGDRNFGSDPEMPFMPEIPIEPIITANAEEDNGRMALRMINSPFNPNIGIDLDSPPGSINPGFPRPDPTPRDIIEVSIIKIGTDDILHSDKFNNQGKIQTNFNLSGVESVPIGFAKQRYIVRFKNISSNPISCVGRVSYNKGVVIKRRDVPLELLNRLIWQTLNALDLTVKLDGKFLSIDVADSVKIHLAKAGDSFKGIDIKGYYKELDWPGISFKNINSLPVEITLENLLYSQDGITYPCIKVKFGFETDGNEIDTPIGDVDFTSADFELKIFLRTRTADDILQGDGGIKGNFDRNPYILIASEVSSNLRLGDDVLSDIVSNFESDLNSIIESTVTDFLNEYNLEISKFIQDGLIKVLDRNLDFFGLSIFNENTWSGFSGPVFNVPELPGIDEILQHADFQFQPIGGPQSDVELGNLQRIDHFVILMQENRSYDHVLGYLSHPQHGNKPEYNGLNGTEKNKIDGISPIARVFPIQNTQFYPGPPHRHESVMKQIRDGNMDGFGNEYHNYNKKHIFDPRSIMDFHKEGQLLTFDKIVKEHCVCTNWYCSFPGPTLPNRFCTFSGSTPYLENDGILDNAGYVNWKTIFDLLDEGGISWKYYEHDLCTLRLVEKYRLNSTNIRPFNELEKESQNDDFNLPSVTFIDPNFSDNPLGGLANDDHPGGFETDMIEGQNLMSKIIKILQRSNNWENTLFLITYDEHGGFFDHMPPPGSDLSSFDINSKVHPDAPKMFGVRVPAFIISPRAQQGSFESRIFDHTSFIKSILLRFLPDKINELGPRVAEAANLGGTVPLQIPRPDTLDYPIQITNRRIKSESHDKNSFHDIITTWASPIDGRINL